MIIFWTSSPSWTFSFTVPCATTFKRCHIQNFAVLKLLVTFRRPHHKVHLVISNIWLLIPLSDPMSLTLTQCRVVLLGDDPSQGPQSNWITTKSFKHDPNRTTVQCRLWTLWLQWSDWWRRRPAILEQISSRWMRNRTLYAVATRRVLGNWTGDVRDQQCLERRNRLYKIWSTSHESLQQAEFTDCIEQKNIRLLIHFQQEKN